MRHISRRTTRLAVLALASFLARAATADEPTARQLLDDARRTNALGLVGAKAEVKLVVDDGHGDAKERRLSASATSLPNGEVRRLVRFAEPAEVRGVGFLVVERPNEPAERLLYLPAQKRVRRVSGSSGDGQFLGTDFSYADSDLAGAADDAPERLPDDTLDGSRCRVVATKSPSAAYARIVTWLDARTGVTLKVVFEGPDHKPVKELDVTRVKQVDGRWYVFESVMKTLAKGTKTTLTVTTLDTHPTLSPDDFTETALEHT